MRQAYTKKFRTKESIQELVELRQEGLSIQALAKKYQCCHSSITYQLQKYFQVGNTWTKNSRDRVKKLNGRERKASGLFCPTCEMLLSSKYHQENPCE